MKIQQQFHLIFLIFVLNGCFILSIQSLFVMGSKWIIPMHYMVICNLLPLLGFMGLLGQVKRQNNNIISNLKFSLSKKIKNVEKNRQCLIKYDDHKGLARLIKQIGKAQRVRTVWMSKPSYNKEYSNLLIRWEAAIFSKLKQGKIIQDVYAANISDTAQLLFTKLKNQPNLKNNYFASEINFAGSPNINFSILNLDNKTKEVWFGWVNHPKKSTKNYCLRTNDAKIIQLFESWFEALQKKSTPIKPYPIYL